MMCIIQDMLKYEYDSKDCLGSQQLYFISHCFGQDQDKARPNCKRDTVKIRNKIINPFNMKNPQVIKLAAEARISPPTYSVLRISLFVFF